MLMPFRYLIKKPKQGEKMNNAQEKKKKIKDEIQDFDKFWDNEQKKEIEKYGDVNQGLGTWNGYEYVKTNGGQ